MINKNRFGVANDKKLLRKIGKQWVTVSALTLVLLGGGAIASSVVTHAATNSPAVETQDINSVKKQLNSNLDKAYQASQSTSGSSVSSSKASQSSASSSQSNSANKPSNVESKASNMHDTLMLNAVNNSNSSSSSSASTKSGVASSESVSASTKPSFNSAYQSYMAKMSGTDSEVASANDSNIQSDAKDKKKSLIKDSAQPDYFSGNVTKTQSASHYRLGYKIWSNGGVEVTNAPSDTDNPEEYLEDLRGDFTLQSDIKNAKAIKIDDNSNIDFSQMSDTSRMFYNMPNLQYLDLGNRFDTTNVTNMSNMFANDSDLQYLNLGNHFNTSNVTNMSDMFDDDYDLYSLTLPSSFDTSKVTNMDDMFDGPLKTNYSTGIMYREPCAKELTITSPLTKFDNDDANLSGLYKSLGFKDSNGDYFTTTTPNDFSKGNVGTFIRGENVPATIKINYEHKGTVMGSQTFYENLSQGNTFTVNSSNAMNIPNGYRLVHSDSTFPLKNNSTYSVAISPIPTSETVKFNDIYGNSDKYSRDLYTPSDMTITGYPGSDYTISAPQGWSFVNPNGTMAGSNNGAKTTFVVHRNAPAVLNIAPDDDGLIYKYNPSIKAIEFVSGTAQSDLSNFNEYDEHPAVFDATSIKFDSDIDTSHVTKMDSMFNGNRINSDYENGDDDSNSENQYIYSNLQSIDFGNHFDTSNVTNMSGMFIWCTNLQSLTLPKSFDTRKAVPHSMYSESHTYDIFDFDNNLNKIVINSPNTQFVGTLDSDGYANNDDLNMWKETGGESSSNEEPYTLSQKNDFSKGIVGTFVRFTNVPTDTINYIYHNQVGTQQFNGKNYDNSNNSDYKILTNKDFTIPNGFQFVGTNNISFDGKTHDVPVKPIQATDKIIYQDKNGKKISSDSISGSSVVANVASDSTTIIDSHNSYQHGLDAHQHGLPNNYHLVNPSNHISFDGGTKYIPVAINPVTDTIDFVNQDNKNVSDTTATGDPTNSFTIPNVPSGYHIDTAKNSNQLTYDGKLHTIYIIPNRATDTINYTYNNKIVSQTTITGNSSNAKDSSDISDTITPDNIPGGIPQGYQLVNATNKVPYDGHTHTVAIKLLPNAFNVIEYIDNNGAGSDVGDTSAYGRGDTNVPDKVVLDDVPKGYQVTQPLPVQFTNNPNDPVVKVAVQSDNDKGDMVVGTAYLTLLYKKGNRTDGQVLRLHINGNIGDSDIIINPQDYDRDGYSIAPSDKDWHIPFDYPTVNSISHGDFSRYNRENTFVYNAQPISINIDYVDTQTGNPVPNTSTQKLSDVAYDGDTIDLQDANSSNGVISVDGNNYRLNLPTGYHLAHGNNYILVNQNATKPVSMVNPLTGHHELRMMPLMKLTLGITPHFNKPTSNSSVTPVKPSSASSVTPKPASSASTEPSSASVVPSSASQSAAPSISAASSMTTPSSMASVTPSVAPSSIISTKVSSAPSSSVVPASVSVKPSSTSTNKTIARSVIHHVSHKHVIKKHAIKPTIHHTSHKKMAKHDTHQLNHQVTKATKQLNIVEHHMKARKAIIRKATHAKRVIKVAKHKLRYLRRNKRHVAHALRRITRNKVAIKHAKRVVHSAKQARPRFVHAKAAPVGPTTDKSTAPSVKAPVATPKVHAKSTATTYTNRKKLPQTSEATDHAGIVAIILMIMSVILAGFDKAFGREHNE